MRYNTIVIGAGLAGLTTACQLVQTGRKTLLVATGVGALLLASGGIDVLGFQPADSLELVKNPLAKLSDFLRDHPQHPYHFTGVENIKAGLETFLQLTNYSALNYQGTVERNWLLPTPAGAVHPTCLAPAALAQGDLSQGGKLLIVGFKELRDFYPALISQNLNEQDLGVEATALALNLPPVPHANQMNVTPIELALAFEQVTFRREVVKAVKANSKGYDRVGFPAVLGLKQHREVVADVEKQLGQPVFEISTLPPSVPGRRLFETLRDIFIEAGGRLIIGSKVVDGTIEDGQVTQIRFETVNQLKSVSAKNYVLATGGIYGGGIQTDAEGGIGQVWEPIFNLPVEADPNRHNWFLPGFLDPKGQPFANYGVKVNDKLNPVTGDGQPLTANLYLAGATIAGADWIRSRTGDGVALATTMTIVKRIEGKG